MAAHRVVFLILLAALSLLHFVNASSTSDSNEDMKDPKVTGIKQKNCGVGYKSLQLKEDKKHSASDRKKQGILSKSDVKESETGGREQSKSSIKTSKNKSEKIKKKCDEKNKDHLYSSKPNLHFRTSSRLTAHRGGKIYASYRQDWYSEYRRHNGHRTTFRKIHLDGPRRNKATYKFDPDEEEEGPSMNEHGALDDLSGDAKTQHISNGDFNIEGGDGLNNNTQTIQTVRRPKFLGSPVPVNIKHNGVVAKSRSGTSNNRDQSWIKYGLVFSIAQSFISAVI